MFIESAYENTLKTLNLGCFPQSVLEYQDSPEFFNQLVFIDYQLQLLIQNEFDGAELVPASLYHGTGNGASTEQKLTQLIEYAESIASNYNDINKDYLDKLYCAILLGHLYFLNSQDDLMHETLNSITVNNSHYHSHKLTLSQNNFLNYLICRYNVLTGVLDHQKSYKLWIEYLCHKEKPFCKTDVAGNYWLDILFKYLSLTISNNGETQVSFPQVSQLKFAENKNSFLRYCNFLINFKPGINVNKIIDKDFKTEYSKYLTSIITDQLKLKVDFPNADDNHKEFDDFIDNLYSTLGKKGKRLINLHTSKKNLISLMEKTYQSKLILIHYIKVLLDLNEYDEALACFRTLINYFEKDEEINKGEIHDILSIIDIYSTCLIKFNPMEDHKNKKFKYTSNKVVVEQLFGFGEKLYHYLEILKKVCHLSYDDDEQFKKHSSNNLSFLYNKYNTNILLKDKNDFIQLVSKSWFSLGYLYYYCLIFNPPPAQDINLTYQKKLITYYKNSLITNSTGSVNYLFNFALTLSYRADINDSIKLCKFILKKFPESFQTWNLLALNSSIGSIKELEKFINNALNIAGIYIIKCKNDEFKIHLNVKYEILQLKLTQLAILEKLYGTMNIMDNLKEVFILYYELFNIKFEEQIKESTPTAEKSNSTDNKWSHRPTLIDPKLNKKPGIRTAKKENAQENIKHISKIKSEHNDLKSLSVNSITDEEKKILQDIWLFTSKIYYKIGYYEELELCIIEAENIYKPNVKTFISLGYLTSKQSKFLSLQEFEKSLEALEEMEFNKLDYVENLLGLCKLFLIDDNAENSLFISSKDLNNGIIRLKNYLETLLACWPLGYNSIEIWYYLSIIYEKFDDKILLNKSLKRCIELESLRPVRNVCHCDRNLYYFSA